MAIFPTFLLANIGQENAFYQILQRKSNFLGYKNEKFKKSKNWHFSNFVFGTIGKEKVVYDILERENPFRGYKNNKFKKSKNGHFSNIFFLRNIRQENVFYDILQKKKQLSRLLKQELQEVEKWTFLQSG